MDDAILAQVPGRFGAGLSQHARLVTLETAQGSALLELLVAESMVVREAVNDLFSIDVVALSVSAEVEVSALLGEELTVTLLQPDHGRRAWHGVCTAADHLGADGGMARYRLLLEPALAELRLRGDSWIFQNKEVRAVVMELLADYPLVRCEFDISEALPVRAICTQYEESDFAFLVRLLASCGLSWRFEHAPAGTDERHGRHKVVIFDARAVAPLTPGGDVLRFHGVRAADSDDAIDRFGARRELQANAVAVSSWDSRQLVAPASERRSSLDAGEVPELSIHEGAGERLLDDPAHADARSDAMLKALELENKTFDGAGAVRRLGAGYRFTLSQHARFPRGLDEFTVMSVRHEARNNFQPGLRPERGIEAGTYRNSFSCLRSSVAIVPPAAASRRAPTAPGPQSALVVGLDNAVATTNRDHQVLVQFGWQRGRRPNDGGLAHDLDADGCAPGNDGSGTWVRVAEAMAGPNWGTVFTPRIGTETMIDFVDGDIDRPVVVGQLYNGVDRPPFPGGVESSVDHPGVLSGIHAASFDGSGYTQWVVDDSAGQLRIRLASSCANTQLNFGYLVDQSPTSSQRGDDRGSGFELRTDAWAVIRGGEGVFLTTATRAAHGCGVESTQLDAAEALSSTTAARKRGQSLADAARQQKALFSDIASKAQDELTKSISPQDAGNNSTAIGQQSGTKTTPGDGNLNAEAAVEKFGKSIVLIDSAAAVNLATPTSSVIYCGESLQWTNQGDAHCAAASTYSMASFEAASVYTHDAGISAVAARGTVSIQAHTDQLQVLADREITFISTNDSIELKAKKKIVVQAGQASMTLDGDAITFACSANFSARSGQHSFDSGASESSHLPSLPDTRLKIYDEGFVVKDEVTGDPIAGLTYRIVRADGSYEEGKTDQNGQTHIVKSAEIETLTLELLR